MQRLQQAHQQQFSGNVIASKALLWTLTLLPLCLAAFAFGLQWQGRGALSGPNSIGPFGGRSSRQPWRSLISSRSFANEDSESDAHANMPSFPRHPGWQYAIVSEARPKISICSSTSAGLDQILPWLYYHRVLGVTDFFLFVEGTAASANSSAVLQAIPVVHRTRELEEKQAKSRIWNETWLASFFYRPCNYELFVRQSLNMEMAIVMARATGMQWIIHLDTDELLHPAGSTEYSLRRLLTDVAEDVDMIVFTNYESAIERDDIKDPFTEVSMFKKNFDHMMKDTYYKFYREGTRGNPNYFLTYGNGKAAARIKPYLRPNGAHRWSNYANVPKEIKLEEAAVLHYPYTKFSDLTSRRDRCGCKPTKEDVKKCFMLEFDREAFIIASTYSEDEMRVWYHQRVVWPDQAQNLKLMKRGLFTRVYGPQVIIQGMREAGVYADALIAGQMLLQKNKSQDQFSSSISGSPERKSSIASIHRGKPDNKSANNQYTNVVIEKNQRKDAQRLGIDKVTIIARRQMLQFLNHTQPKAIPPLPSPGLQESQV